MTFEKILKPEKPEKKAETKPKSGQEQSLGHVLELARKRRKQERVKLTPDEDKRLFLILTKAIKAEKAGDLAKAIEYYTDYKDELLKIKVANQEKKEGMKEGFEVDITEYDKVTVPVEDDEGVVFLAMDKGDSFLIDEKNQKISKPLEGVNLLSAPVKVGDEYWCLTESDPPKKTDYASILNISTGEISVFISSDGDPDLVQEIMPINDDLYVILESAGNQRMLSNINNQRVVIDGKTSKISQPLFYASEIVNDETFNFLVDQHGAKKSKKYEFIYGVTEINGEILFIAEQTQKRYIRYSKTTQSVVDLDGNKIGKNYGSVLKLKEVNGKPMFSVSKGGKSFLVDHTGKRVSKKMKENIVDFEVINGVTYFIRMKRTEGGDYVIIISNDRDDKRTRIVVNGFKSSTDKAMNIGGKLYLSCRKQKDPGALYCEYIVDENGEDVIDGKDFQIMNTFDFNGNFYCHAIDKETKQHVLLDEKSQVLISMAGIFYIKQAEDGRVYIIGTEERGDKVYYVKRVYRNQCGLMLTLRGLWRTDADFTLNNPMRQQIQLNMAFEKILKPEKPEKKAETKPTAGQEQSLGHVLELARKRRKVERVKLTPDEDKRLFLILNKAIKAEKAGDLAKAIEYYTDYTDELLKIKDRQESQAEKLKEFEVDVTKYFDFEMGEGSGDPLEDDGGIVFLAMDKGENFLINEKNEKISDSLKEIDIWSKPVKVRDEYWCVTNPVQIKGKSHAGILNINTGKKSIFIAQGQDIDVVEKIISINDNVYVIIESFVGRELADINNHRVSIMSEVPEISQPLFYASEIVDAEIFEVLVDQHGAQKSKKHEEIGRVIEIAGEISYETFYIAQQTKERYFRFSKTTESVVDLDGNRIGRKYDVVHKLKEVNGKPMFSVSKGGKSFLVDHAGKRVSKKMKEDIVDFEVIDGVTYFIKKEVIEGWDSYLIISNDKDDKESRFSVKDFESSNKAMNIGGKLYVSCRKWFTDKTKVMSSYIYIVDEKGEDVFDGKELEIKNIYDFNGRLYCHAINRKNNQNVVLDDKSQELVSMDKIFYVKQTEDGRIYVIGREKRGDKMYYVKRFIDAD